MMYCDLMASKNKQNHKNVILITSSNCDFERKIAQIIISPYLLLFMDHCTPWSLIMPFFVEKECISNAQGLLVCGVARHYFLPRPIFYVTRGRCYSAVYLNCLFYAFYPINSNFNTKHILQICIKFQIKMIM